MEIIAFNRFVLVNIIFGKNTLGFRTKKIKE